MPAETAASAERLPIVVQISVNMLAGRGVRYAAVSIGLTAAWVPTEEITMEQSMMTEAAMP